MSKEILAHKGPIIKINITSMPTSIISFSKDKLVKASLIRFGL